MTTDTTTATHTPGPWRVSDDHPNRGPFEASIIGPMSYGQDIGKTRILAEVRGLDWLANARLIAAAPDLLAALKATMDTLEDLQQAEMFHALGEDYCQNVLTTANTVFAAIAKATGTPEAPDYSAVTDRQFDRSTQRSGLYS